MSLSLSLCAGLPLSPLPPLSAASSPTNCRSLGARTPQGDAMRHYASYGSRCSSKAASPTALEYRSRLRTDSCFGMMESPWAPSEYNLQKQSSLQSLYRFGQINDSVPEMVPIMSAAWGLSPYPNGVSPNLVSMHPFLQPQVGVHQWMAKANGFQASTTNGFQRDLKSMPPFSCASESVASQTPVLAEAVSTFARTTSSCHESRVKSLELALADLLLVKQDDRESRTTVMIRNLPKGLMPTDLMQLLDSIGMEGKYDFLYMPFSFDTLTNLPHAFLNMSTPDDALLLWKALDGYSSWPVKGGEQIRVAWNDKQQGLQALIERYKNSPVMHECVPAYCKPMIFREGVATPFPAPTELLKMPKFRRGLPIGGSS